MTTWHVGRPESYPKIYALGHRAIADLLDGFVVVQEKVDGSQFTFMIDEHGDPRCFSKRTELDVKQPESLFQIAVGTVVRLAHERRLVHGNVYRGEAFRHPRHNTLTYERMPAGGIVLFDVQYRGDIGDALHYSAAHPVEYIAEQLGVEPVRTIYTGLGSGLTQSNLDEWMSLVSQLGGCKVEGVVIKNYDRFTIDGKTMMGKYVRAEFKESNRVTHAPKAGAVETLIERFRCEARWRKAVEHLRDAGELQGDPRDIPVLLREVNRDLTDEEGGAIKDALWSHYKRDILRGVTKGMPEWYKERLAAQQFGGEQ